MIDRYSRQIPLPEIGKEGQRRLGNSSVVVIGCGGLGSIIATSLVRAGVGKVKIIDRDIIEYHNLHRQVLFDEADVKSQLPKATVAGQHLKRVNSSVEIEGIVADVNYTNIESFVSEADIILDGLDNLETRFLINDVSLKHEVPWIYGGAISSHGMTMTIIPHEPPCFRCFLSSPNRSHVIDTCDTAGVISPAPFVIAALQTAEALKVLVGAGEINRDLVTIDVWEGTFHHYKISSREGCPAGQGKYEYLDGKFSVIASALCGQNAVQVLNTKVGQLSFK